MHPLDRLARLDATAQTTLVERRELTPLDLLAAAQRRYEAINPLVRAIVSVDFDAARERAGRSEGGSPRLFAGVPFACKDLLMVPGMRCAFGSRLLARNVANAGSPLTKKLDEAGLVTFAKTSTSEFGLLGSTETLADGITHNPWNLSLSAAGSSGGAAAAVAAGLVALAHASDGGGSVRIPAGANGVFGFKPSRGRTAPSAPTTSSFDALVSDGCVSRSVRDAARWLRAVQSDECALEPLPTSAAQRAPRLRIALALRSLMGTEPSSEVRRAIEQTAQLCRELGHTVIEDDVLTREADDSSNGRALSDAFFAGAGLSLGAMCAMFSTMLGREPGPEELEPFTLAVIAHARTLGAEAPAMVRRTFERCAARYLDATQHYDVILTPVIAQRPWQLGWLSPLLSREELLRRTESAVCYTPIQNVAGCPAMSVPLCWADDETPIGSHFAAAPGRDSSLLSLAFELEQARPWADRWAPHSFVRAYGA